MAFQISPRARHDLQEIWDYIAQDDEAAANRTYDDIREHFQMLGRSPRIGRRRDELRSGVRSFPVGEYLILYFVKARGVKIARVIHGRRDLFSLLRS